MRLPSGVSCFLFESLLARNSIWPSLERVTRDTPVAGVLDDEARVAHGLLAAHALQVGLPALAVGRVREHEVELARREGVVGEGRVLGTADDVVGRLALPLQQQVGLADGVRLGVILLSVEMRETRFPGRPQAAAASPPATVSMPPVPQARRRAGRCPDRIRSATGRNTSFAISRTASRGAVLPPPRVLLVEAADQLLGRSSPRRGCRGRDAGPSPSAFRTGAGPRLTSGEVSFSISVARASAFDSRGIWLRNSKFSEDPARWARTLRGRREVGLEPLPAGAGAQVAQRERRGVVERLPPACRRAESCSTTPYSSSTAFILSTLCLLSSSTASSRRSTIIGRMTSRYLPRT